MRMKVTLAVIFLICASAPLSAQIVTCQQLINEAAVWDGKTVSIAGEVVGDILRAGKFEWLNVNDGTNALGVWTDTKDVEGMEIVPGNYSIIGTSLEVEGIFNRTCSLHSGETDIHLVNVKVVGEHNEVDASGGWGQAIVCCHFIRACSSSYMGSRLKKEIIRGNESLIIRELHIKAYRAVSVWERPFLFRHRISKLRAAATIILILLWTSPAQIPDFC